MYRHRFELVTKQNVDQWTKLLTSQLIIVQENEIDKGSSIELVIEHLRSDLIKSTFMDYQFYLSIIQCKTKSEWTNMIMVGVKLFAEQEKNSVQGIFKVPSVLLEAIHDPQSAIAKRSKHLSMPLHSATANAIVEKYPNITDYKIDGPLDMMVSILEMAAKKYDLTMHTDEGYNIHIEMNDKFLSIWNNFQSLSCLMCGSIARFRCAHCHKEAYCGKECAMKNGHVAYCKNQSVINVL